MPKGGNGNGDKGRKPPKIVDQAFDTPEGPADGTLLGMVVADVKPSRSTWSILSGNDDGAFSIDPLTGELYVADGSAVDYEAEPTRELVVEVVENGKKAHSATVTVNVSDVNETPSAGPDVVASFAETVDQITVLASVAATDPDTLADSDSDPTNDDFNDLAYAITGGDPDDLFEIDANGNISLAAGKSLDYETAQQHVLQVTVADKDGEGLSDTAQVTINVSDVNEAPSAGPDIEVSVPETTDQITYQYQGSPFTSASGVYSTSMSVSGHLTIGSDLGLNIDIFLTPDSHLELQDFSFTDGVNNITLANTTNYGIRILTDGSGDISDWRVDLQKFNRDNPALPDNVGILTCTIGGGYCGEFASTGTGGTTFGDLGIATNTTERGTWSLVSADMILASVAATDPDTFADSDADDANDTFNDLSYAITDGDPDGLFEIDANGNISLAAGKGLDYETAQQHVLEVTVTDGGGLSDTAEVTVNVMDVNEVGGLDAFVANQSQTNQVLLNDGTGTFTEATSQPPGSASTLDAALGDLDGDGDLDAFVANDGANQVLLNDGTGTFTAPAALQPPGTAFSAGVALGDLDGDGDLDAFVANWGDNQVLINDGTGTFTEAASQPPGSDLSFYVALGDLDGDGDLDAVIASRDNQVLINDGTGTFTEAASQPPVGTYSFDVALGDLDGDGTVAAVDENGLPNIDSSGLLPSMYVDIII